MLQSMGLQRSREYLAIEQQQIRGECAFEQSSLWTSVVLAVKWEH